LCKRQYSLRNFTKQVERFDNARAGYKNHRVFMFDTTSNAKSIENFVVLKIQAVICRNYRPDYSTNMNTQLKETIERIACAIDHTALKPQTTHSDIEILCNEAIKHGFASVCVNPSFVSLAARHLAGSCTATGTVIGFPLGATLPDVKIYEAIQCMAAGATELDLAANIPLLKSGDSRATDEIAAICKIAHSEGVLVKVIIETSLLNESEKIYACEAVARSGADFIKTSTGFSGGGATVEDILLLRKHSPVKVRVKASGGIRDAKFAIALLDAGAERLGTSAGVAIMQSLLSEIDE